MSKNTALVQRMNLPSTLDFSGVKGNEIILTENAVSTPIPIGNADSILCGFSGTFDGATAHLEISIDGENWDSFFSTKSDDIKHVQWAPYMRASTKGGTAKTNIKALIARRVK